MVEIDTLVIIKFFELLLAIVCMGLHEFGRSLLYSHDTLAAITFGAFIIIICGSFLARLMESEFEPYVDIMFTAVGAILFIATGVITLIEFTQDKHPGFKTRGICKGVIALICSTLFIVDIILTFEER